MRLINVHTLEMREFPNPPTSYAMLSHRWSDEELTFQNYHLLHETDTAGTRKVIGFCDFVRGCNGVGQHVDWIWVDSCCIDKTSSAELSESINSMYAWYERCTYCVAYLMDVKAPNLEDGTEEFESSEYFLRGWTLGELLAPDTLYFCNVKWQVLGVKRKPSLHQDRQCMESVNRATGIESRYLVNRYSISMASVAQRFSWASQRSTTRPEDMAYCLMGLFGIHMPLLYGEGGTNAFRRLQEEIIKRSNDESIFGWTTGDFGPTGILAEKPEDFGSCRDVHRIFAIEREPYTITNKGLRIRCDAVQVSAPLPYYVIPMNYVKGKFRAGDSSLPSTQRCRPSPCMIMLQELGMESGSFERTHGPNRLISSADYSIVKDHSKKLVRNKEFYVELGWDNSDDVFFAKMEVEALEIDHRNTMASRYLFGYTDASGNFVPPEWHDEF